MFDILDDTYPEPNEWDHWPGYQPAFHQYHVCKNYLRQIKEDNEFFANELLWYKESIHPLMKEWKRSLVDLCSAIMREVPLRPFDLRQELFFYDFVSKALVSIQKYPGELSEDTWKKCLEVRETLKKYLQNDLSTSEQWFELNRDDEDFEVSHWNSHVHHALFQGFKRYGYIEDGVATPYFNTPEFDEFIVSTLHTIQKEYPTWENRIFPEWMYDRARMEKLMKKDFLKKCYQLEYELSHKACGDEMMKGLREFRLKNLREIMRKGDLQAFGRFRKKVYHEFELEENLYGPPWTYGAYDVNDDLQFLKWMERLILQLKPEAGFVSRYNTQLHALSSRNLKYKFLCTQVLQKNLEVLQQWVSELNDPNRNTGTFLLKFLRRPPGNIDSDPMYKSSYQKFTIDVDDPYYKRFTEIFGPIKSSDTDEFYAPSFYNLEERDDE